MSDLGFAIRGNSDHDFVHFRERGCAREQHRQSSLPTGESEGQGCGQSLGISANS
jgi:hypothetical protein